MKLEIIVTTLYKEKYHKTGFAYKADLSFQKVNYLLPRFFITYSLFLSTNITDIRMEKRAKKNKYFIVWNPYREIYQAFVSIPDNRKKCHMNSDNVLIFYFYFHT
jgi:hypothetical protein